jgi:REP element-mobilizing transposase RayT
MSINKKQPKMKSNRRTFWRLYYHVVWRTKNDEPMLTPKVKHHLLHYIRLKCAELECPVEALNAVADHVHLCCRIPPKLAVAEFVQRVKGSSSHHVNHELNLGVAIEWQRGYGVSSVSPRHVKGVVEYVERQEERHRAQKLVEDLEQTEEVEEEE